ncbi:5'-nucleotidase, lipoprotein e(P4) family [Cellvibrio sp. NN19]|uniref:5'-nucleotidase, lipoprotein e(P4) family n=1 Tax=Cellvibrio chitinivorans TaxID=3102792 RepID=UPI002B402CC4|nr:HAD family acid phosphatase [Cellvibrio sp. NN19]
MLRKPFYSLRASALFTAICSLGACSTTTPNSANTTQSYEHLNAILWMQTSAEYYAAASSTYAQASSTLDQALADKNWTAATEQTSNYQHLPPAVILDIDETVLDNIPFQAQLLKDNQVFEEKGNWHEWTKLAQAEPIPGAAAFLALAQQKGITIFYVTNRDASQEEFTRENLRRKKLPLREDIDTVLTKNENGWSSDKTARRSYVSKNFRVIALVGDDFGDFVSGVKVDTAQRFELAKKHSANWGSKWFLIPNPVYGSWEAAMYNYDYSMPAPVITKHKLEQMNTIK